MLRDGFIIFILSCEIVICHKVLIYIGEFGSITTYETGDETHLYYNPTVNLFGFSGSRVSVVTFNEISFLVPTPDPIYPDSFDN